MTPSTANPISVPAFARIHTFAGVWAISEEHGRLIQQTVERIDFSEHFRHQAEIRAEIRSATPAPVGLAAGGGGGYGYTVEDGVARFELTGLMMKQAASFGDGTSTAMLRRDLRQARNDPAVKGALMVIDSPGGHAAGTSDLAEEIAAFAAVKPLVGFGEDLVASAAMWAASQTTEFYANAGALVGSIGSYTVLRDYSVAAAQAGVKTYVIRAGTYKGAGTPGTEITPDMLAEFQRTVNLVNAPFVAAVAQGRRIAPTKAAELADGRIHSAAAAKELGLIDGVMTLDGAMARVRTLIQQNNNSGPRGSGTSAGSGGSSPAAKPRSLPMSQQDNTAGNGGPNASSGSETAGGAASTANPTTLAVVDPRRPATIAELRQTFNDAEFVIEQAEKAATMDEAKREWSFLQKRLGQTATTPAKSVGVKALSDGPPAAKASASGDPTEMWNARIEEGVKAGKPRQEVVKSLVRDEPELHAAFLDAHNAKYAKRAIRPVYGR